MHGQPGAAGASKMPLDNWFDRGGLQYARFRPTYPARLADWLAGAAPDRLLAVDAGCGSGQLAALLADGFEQVVGLDPSVEQLAHAAARHRVHYVAATAENLPLGAGCASLVVAAQAAHWFDLRRFHAEARRVARPGGCVALVSYGVLQPEADIAARFMAFYSDEVGPYWPSERGLVDGGYRDIVFPFTERGAPPFAITLDWTLAEFLGYVSTWSAVRRLHAAGQGAVLERFVADIARLWGDAGQERRFRWPLHLRVGSV